MHVHICVKGIPGLPKILLFHFSPSHPLPSAVSGQNMSPAKQSAIEKYDLANGASVDMLIV